jgi:hypothetical protein
MVSHILLVPRCVNIPHLVLSLLPLTPARVFSSLTAMGLLKKKMAVWLQSIQEKRQLGKLSLL